MQSLARRLERGDMLSCPGVSPAAQPFLAVCLKQMFPQRPFLIVAPSPKAQESFFQDIGTWLALAGREANVERQGPANATNTTSPSSPQPSTTRRVEAERRRFDPRPLFYPAWEILPHEARLPHVDVISDRLETLVTLSQLSILNPVAGRSAAQTAQPPTLVVTSVTALLQRTFSPGDLRARTRTLQRGDRLDPLDLMEWLEEQGYEPEAQVTQKGEIALRGGILDVFPLTGRWPVRLEFFGDELESLRCFDPLTQISREQITRAVLPPGGELGILKRMQNAECRMQNENSQPSTRINCEQVLNPQLRPGTLPDYLPRETIFLLAEPGQLACHAAEYAQQVPPGDPFFVPWEELLAKLDRNGMTRLEVSEDQAPVRDSSFSGSALSGEGRDEIPDSAAAPRFTGLDAYRPLLDRAPEPQVAEAQRREFFNQLHRWLRQGYAVHVFCNNEGERRRFEEIWREYGLESPKSSVQSPKSVDPSPTSGSAEHRWTLDLGLWTHLGSLARGFICDEAKLIVITDAEIFGRYKVQRPRRLKSAQAQTARSALDIDFTDLAEGDLVVHLQHGIGRYLGLQTMPLGTRPEPKPSTLSSDESRAGPQPSTTECLVLEFAPADPDLPPPKLYVPVTEAHLVSKYVGAGKARPPLNTLGGMRWVRARQQAERAVRDVASELLSIQAARESQAGHPFAPDTPWQREFESAFIFEETPDQARAIHETKADMERPKPMDRLLCGDVAFGKTEVAIRAAFKAVMDGKQVAVLVPTTVLAQQHFNTFRDRMADYPVRIELLSRFRTRGQQQRVVQELAAGSVDIVIGTHRLLQDDIAFKDLGLVVIDEEQRFGVMHKEKFKMLRRLVDVLTLSATPIPRTLYLALTGARDMSTIQTPPQDRLPVETIVAQYDERVIRDAIQRELNRGGQVFFLHNRVLTIHTIEQKLRALVPNARIVVGHGQMHSDELEEVMTRFVNGEADVLLSTTIIESGLDIPNANTIIIDRADRFGLSDLYQLRGRVGRYKHQAYAYLLLPRHARLLTDVRQRIGAIRQYATLGSGFKIAMRDLEIRGAGNLLGAEQSGHITAVGFELYCQLLKQSVAALKGEKVKPRIEVEVRLDFLGPLDEVRRVKGEGRTAEGSRAPVETRTSPLALRPSPFGPRTACAALPHPYVPEPQHRIEIYRKLAQANDQESLENLTRELSDRFGPPPPPAQRLLQVAELKMLAADRGVTTIEVKGDKLMLTRRGDFITLGGKFPRLTKKSAAARLKEIKKLLLAL